MERTIADLAVCAQREVIYRKKRYPFLVRDGTMTESDAVREIQTMQAIVNLLDEKLQPTSPFFEILRYR
jgi:hypothetical protein